MSAKIRMQGKIVKRLDGIIAKGKSPRAFLERIVYPTYLKAQMKKWMTEGRTDGYGQMSPWQKLNPAYKKAKLKRFATAPGAGSKMLVASGRLFQAVLNQGPGHRKIIAEKSLIVGIDPAAVPYTKYVNAKRPIFIFSKQMMGDIRKKYGKFMMERGT